MLIKNNSNISFDIVSSQYGSQIKRITQLQATPGKTTAYEDASQVLY
jgi:hypothetical protein